MTTTNTIPQVNATIKLHDTVADLEFKLASIKGNTPADEGRRAAIKDEIARAIQQ